MKIKNLDEKININTKFINYLNEKTVEKFKENMKIIEKNLDKNMKKINCGKDGCKAEMGSSLIL